MKSLEGEWSDAEGMDEHDPFGMRRVRNARTVAAFGIGPIARVPTLAAMARPGVGPGWTPGGAGRPVGTAAWRIAGASRSGGPGAADRHRSRPAFGLETCRRNVCPHF